MLFGESLNTLTNDDNQVASAQFATAFKRSQTELARRCRLGRLADWNVSKEFLDACRFTQRFVDGYVQKAMRVRARHLGNHQTDGEKAPQEPEEKKGRYVFLEELALRVDDPVAVRDHLLNVLIPARDSTSTLLAAAVFAIAKDPQVMRRLQDEVRELDGAHPSFERLKNMKYLQWVMNESMFLLLSPRRVCMLVVRYAYETCYIALRLWPIVPLNGRQALCDVTLPVGGVSASNPFLLFRCRRTTG